MNLFLDTSSLIKLYHKEEGTDLLLQIIKDEKPTSIILSDIAELEFKSAFWKKVRLKEIAQENAEKVIYMFEKDAEKFEWVPLELRVKSLASKLISKYGLKGLRTLDSLQLSSAILASDENPDLLNLVSDKLLSEIFILEELNSRLI